MGCSSSSLNVEKENFNNRPKINITSNTFIKHNRNIFSNEYKLLSLIGTGSYGRVYESIHIKTNNTRVVKICKNDLDNEINILSKIDHPHIVKLYEYFSDDNYFYICLEHISGGSLIDKLEKINIFDENSVCLLMKQLLSCINYLHKNNIIHRDLKPDNIVLEDKNDLQIKLIDFGNACFSNGKMKELCGTYYYLAPEVIDEDYDNKCDIWSCGVIMYFLLSGNPPFRGRSAFEVMNKIKECKIKFEEKIWEIISSEGKDLILKMLEKDSSIRITGDEALKHPWFIVTKKEFSKHLLDEVKMNMKKFLSKNLLQVAFSAYFIHHSNFTRKIKELRELYVAMDKNYDGRLTYIELKKGYKEYLHDPFLDRNMEDIFQYMNTNNNEFIEYEEFLRGCINVELYVPKEQLREAFNHFDIDGSGKISKSELKNILSVNDKNDEYMKKMIDIIDSDKDGEISFEEFLNNMKN